MKQVIDSINFSYRKPAPYLQLDVMSVMMIYKAGRKFIGDHLSHDKQLSSIALQSLSDFLNDSRHMFKPRELTLFHEFLEQTGSFSPGGFIYEEIRSARSLTNNQSDEETLDQVYRRMTDYLTTSYNPEKSAEINTFAALQLINHDNKISDRLKNPNDCLSSILRELNHYKDRFGKKADGVISEGLHSYVHIMEQSAEIYGPWVLPTEEDLNAAKLSLEKTFPNVKQVDKTGDEIQITAA